MCSMPSRSYREPHSLPGTTNRSQPSRSAEWRADCISRRLGILYREPVTVKESGTTAARQNLRVYLVRDVAVRGAEKYLT